MASVARAKPVGRKRDIRPQVCDAADAHDERQRIAEDRRRKFDWEEGMKNEFWRLARIIKAFYLWEEDAGINYRDAILSPFALADRWLCCWCV